MAFENARIKATKLGMDDFMPTVWIDCEYRGMCESYGGIDLRLLNFAKLLPALLLVCGAVEWEHVKGKYVRIERDKDGAIARLGHIVHDDWFQWQEFAIESTPGDAK
jgi:hypothetical protein